jgi:diguanylate cyclase (GGDEF)-like protein
LVGKAWPTTAMSGGVPLLAERQRSGRVRGVARMVRGDGRLIEVEMSARVFSEADGAARTCTIIRDVSERVATEHELKQLTARLSELSLTDELTGLRNRRGFVTVGSQTLEVADRQLSSAHVLYLDVDNMKELNDRYGHVIGDAALRAVARALTAGLRRADLVARIGGDEFVALALGLEDADHGAIEKRIHDYLRSPRTIADVGSEVDVSIGWTLRAPSGSGSVEDLLAAADKAMYRAKPPRRA